MRVDLDLTVNTEDLVYALSELTDDALFQFISELDASKASWEFTNTLHRYFEGQYEIYLEEVAADD